MAQAVLVRHGQTGWSREGRRTESSDVPLTSAGQTGAPVPAACRLGLSPGVGQQLALGAGSVSVLGAEHGCPAVLSWNA